MNLTITQLLSLILILYTGELHGCIFGSDKGCFFQCKCQKDICSDLDQTNQSMCTPCDSITGHCPSGCLTDKSSKVYETSYWSGPGCQTGNLAYRQNILDANHVETLKGATDGDFNYGTFDTLGSTFSLSIYLDAEYHVEFIDVFQDDFYKEPFVDFHLERADGNISQCKRGPSGNNRLRDSQLDSLTRIYHTCESPSIAKKIHITSSGLSRSNFVSIHELVIIGQKYVDVDESRCLSFEGSDILKWCSQCEDSYPPECRKDCPSGFSGINCVSTTGSTQHTGDASDTKDGSTEDKTPGSTSVLPAAIGATLSIVVIIIVVTIVACLLWRRSKAKRREVKDQASVTIPKDKPERPATGPTVNRSKGAQNLALQNRSIVNLYQHTTSASKVDNSTESVDQGDHAKVYASLEEATMNDQIPVSDASSVPVRPKYPPRLPSKPRAMEFGCIDKDNPHNGLDSVQLQDHMPITAEHSGNGPRDNNGLGVQSISQAVSSTGDYERLDPSTTTGIQDSNEYTDMN